MIKHAIPDTDEAWDAKALGAEEEFAGVVSDEEEASIDQAAGTQLVSIRMHKCMIDDFKLIASLNGGIGYQTLMKQILQRFADSEKKRIFRDLVSEKLKEQEKKGAVSSGREQPARQPKVKKAA